MNRPPPPREASAHAKLLLFGEHAAVHGYPAVGCALPWSLEVAHAPDPAALWRLEGIRTEDEPALLLLIGRIAQRMDLLGLPRPAPGHLRISSSIPSGAGFGSSGALCAALARVFYPSATAEEHWETAHDGEAVFHGRPSGIDTGLALEKGLLAFWPRPPRLPRCQFLSGFPMTLVVGAVRRQTGARALIEDLGARLRSGDPTAKGLLTQLGVLAEKAIGLLDTSSSDFLIGQIGRSVSHIQTLAFLASKAQENLRALGLSTKELDEVLELGMRQGALGGKLSGAGGGGAFFLVYEDRRAAEASLKGMKSDERWKRLEFVRPPTLFSWTGGAWTDD